MILKRDNVEIAETNPEKIRALMDEGFCPVSVMAKPIRAAEEAKVPENASKMLKEEAKVPENASKMPEADNEEQYPIEEIEAKIKMLAALKKDELVKIAEDSGISGAKNFTKAELIEVMSDLLRNINEPEKAEQEG